MLSINPEDTSKLIRTVRSNYNFDLSEFGFNLLRYRVSNYLSKHLIKDNDHLIDHLFEDETFMDDFLSGISAGSSELFRDPSMWKHLRKEIIPQLLLAESQPVFWLPRSVSGHDAYSLLIMLTEEKWINSCHICSSASNFADLKNLQAGKLSPAFMSMNRQNYLNAGGKKSLDDYFNRTGDHIKPNLNRKITFTRHFNMLHNAPERVDMIMIRNQFLNYTKPVKTNLLNNLTEILSSGGILVMGVKEVIEEDMIRRKYDTVVGDEGIYRKKI